MSCTFDRRMFLKRFGALGAGLGAFIAEPSHAWSRITGLAQSAPDTCDTARISTSAGGSIRSSNLMRNMTFDSFVPGESNRLAFEAAMAVADRPAPRWNPLVIYGGVGLGKTHLLHAIGNRFLERNPGSGVMYFSSETFINDLINSIRYDRMGSFRSRYRQLDLLLVDDIQFIAGKEKTQEEFFHTFNSVHELHKQLVLTSSKMPRKIPDLDECLRSRFHGGLTVSINAPENDLRLAIVHQKAEYCGARFPENVKRYIAARPKAQCIRSLEGDVIRLNAYSCLDEKKIDLAYAREILERM